jgi:hypothetical protein
MRTAPILAAQLKVHMPIRPVTCNIDGPTYNVIKRLVTDFEQLKNLPHTYITKNSSQIASEFVKLQISSDVRLVTFDKLA